MKIRYVDSGNFKGKRGPKFKFSNSKVDCHDTLTLELIAVSERAVGSFKFVYNGLTGFEPTGTGITGLPSGYAQILVVGESPISYEPRNVFEGDPDQQAIITGFDNPQGEAVKQYQARVARAHDTARKVGEYSRRFVPKVTRRLRRR